MSDFAQNGWWYFRSFKRVGYRRCFQGASYIEKRTNGGWRLRTRNLVYVKGPIRTLVRDFGAPKILFKTPKMVPCMFSPVKITKNTYVSIRGTILRYIEFCQKILYLKFSLKIKMGPFFTKRDKDPFVIGNIQRKQNTVKNSRAKKDQCFGQSCKIDLKKRIFYSPKRYTFWLVLKSSIYLHFEYEGRRQKWALLQVYPWHTVGTLISVVEWKGAKVRSIITHIWVEC